MIIHIHKKLDDCVNKNASSFSRNEIFILLYHVRGLCEKRKCSPLEKKKRRRRKRGKTGGKKPSLLVQRKRSEQMALTSQQSDGSK